MGDVTRILSAIEGGDAQAAERLLPMVYDEFDELRKLASQKMAQETLGQTLQATELDFWATTSRQWAIFVRFRKKFW